MARILRTNLPTHIAVSPLPREVTAPAKQYGTRNGAFRRYFSNRRLFFGIAKDGEPVLLGAHFDWCSSTGKWGTRNAHIVRYVV